MMRFLPLTLPTLAENLALDEALLEQLEASREGSPEAQPAEVLRIWESPETAVVLGRASKVDQEVERERCASLSIPIGRRSSGGATVVIGPGCLMYGLLLSLDKRPACRRIDNAHELVMSRFVDTFERLGLRASFQGTCDLTRDDRKFSGNSLRCKRHYILYHGTLLYAFELEAIGRLLRTPPRQPDYRMGREHKQFVTNQRFEVDALSHAIRQSWQASQELEEWPCERTRELVETRYSRSEWTFRH